MSPLRRKIKKVLREHYGNFQSKLEREYEKTIIENLEEGRKRREWVTYNQLILEIKHTIDDSIYLKELQYRITGNEDPNDVCIDIINKIGESSPELQRLGDKIRNF